MIAHFTENIYDIGIALSVSGGDPAPLVGHNAFLRCDPVEFARKRQNDRFRPRRAFGVV